MSSFHVDRSVTLVQFLTEALPQMKRGTLKDRLRDGEVWVNGAPERKATFVLSPGDTVELRRERAPQGARAIAPGGVELLHVDRELVVVNKPSGLLTVGAGRSGEATVLNVVGPQLKGGSRLFPCHRLDKGTSGVLLLPRSPEVQQFFFGHWDQVQKTYVAVVHGRVAQDSGTVRAMLLENTTTLSVTVSSHADAREAVTHFQVLARSAQCTLVELRIETGRKHQIRVHMQHLGHPVLGDDRYAGSAARAPRLFLHARELVFPHPATAERLTFSAAVPALFLERVPAR